MKITFRKTAKCESDSLLFIDEFDRVFKIRFNQKAAFKFRKYAIMNDHAIYLKLFYFKIQS